VLNVDFSAIKRVSISSCTGARIICLRQQYKLRLYLCEESNAESKGCHQEAKPGIFNASVLYYRFYSRSNHHGGICTFRLGAWDVIGLPASNDTGPASEGAVKHCLPTGNLAGRVDCNSEPL